MSIKYYFVKNYVSLPKSNRSSPSILLATLKAAERQPHAYWETGRSEESFSQGLGTQQLTSSGKGLWLPASSLLLWWS